MIVIFAYLKIPKEKQDFIEEQVKIYRTKVKQENGNIEFEVATNKEGELFFWEKFKSKEAFEDHKKQKHFNEWRKFYKPFLLERKLEELKLI